MSYIVKISQVMFLLSLSTFSYFLNRGTVANTVADLGEVWTCFALPLPFPICRAHLLCLYFMYKDFLYSTDNMAGRYHKQISGVSSDSYISKYPEVVSDLESFPALIPPLISMQTSLSNSIIFIRFPKSLHPLRARRLYAGQEPLAVKRRGIE